MMRSIILAVLASSCSALSLSSGMKYSSKLTSKVKAPEFWNAGSMPPRCKNNRKKLTEIGENKAPMAILAGVPKSGTTFLWDCMIQALSPERICETNDAEDWTPEKCDGSKFLLPQLKPFVGSTSMGHVIKTSPNKESMYWGRSYPRAGMEAYLGPDVPLDVWSAKGAQKAKLIQDSCQGVDTQKGDCTCWALKDEPMPGLHSLPFLLTPPKVGGIQFLEGTPNNLMNAKTPKRIASEYSKEDLQKIPIVAVLRDPGARAYSEWAMFLWWYHQQSNFSISAEEHIHKFKACKAQAGDEPTDGQILEKCVPGEAMDILGSGLYSLGLQNWMDLGFHPSQFLIVSQNTLSALTKHGTPVEETGEGVLAKIAKFLKVKWVPTSSRPLPKSCQGVKVPFNIDKSKPMTSDEKDLLSRVVTRDSDGEDKKKMKAAVEKRGMTLEMKAQMKSFFGPYNKQLKERLTKWKAQGMQFLMDKKSEEFFPDMSAPGLD